MVVDTRSQTKARSASAAQPLPPYFAVPGGSVFHPSAESVSEVFVQQDLAGSDKSFTSRSSATIHARTLAAQATYARKIVDIERAALDLELRAQIAQIEADEERRSRQSSRRGSTIKHIEAWLENVVDTAIATTPGLLDGAATADIAPVPACPGGTVPGDAQSAILPVRFATANVIRSDVPDTADLVAPRQQDHYGSPYCPATVPNEFLTYSSVLQTCTSKPSNHFATNVLITAAPKDSAHQFSAREPVLPNKNNFLLNSVPEDPVHPFSAQEPVPVPTASDPARGKMRYSADIPGVSRPPFCTAASAEEGNKCESDIMQLARAMFSLVRNNNSATPRFGDGRLPLFDGKPTDWLAFKRAYLDSSATYSRLDNLARIGMALRGTAKEAVAALLITAHDPSEVIAALEVRFAKPEVIVLQEVSTVRALPKLNPDGKELNVFACRVRNCVSVMKFLGHRAYLESPELFHALLSKLTPLLRARWADYGDQNYNKDSGTTKLELLADFLAREVRLQFNFGLISESTIHSCIHNVQQYNFNRRTQHAEKVCTSTIINKSVKENKCLFCQLCHSIDTCEKFILLSSQDRCQWAREQKVCNRCLKKGLHRYKSCNSKHLCKVSGCKYKHHKLLHNFESVAHAPEDAPDTNRQSTVPSSPVESINIDSEKCETGLSF